MSAFLFRCLIYLTTFLITAGLAAYILLAVSSER